MERNVTDASGDSFGGKAQRPLDKFLVEFNLFENDCSLNYEKFRAICSAIFQEDEIENNQWRVEEMFGLFDRDKDQVLKDQEWKRFCDWLRITLTPISALIIVDVQNDFIDGTLALRSCGSNQDGADVIEPINRIVRAGKFDKIIYSLDWHPEDHIGFYDNLHLRELNVNTKVTKRDAKPFDKVTFARPCVEQTLWPRHCVMGTWGAELHKDLIIAPGSKQVRKGQNSDVDAYSVFFDNSEGSTELQTVLQKSAVTDLYVCGLAYDVCVKATCLDGLRLGYALAVIDDCCRGINASNIEATKELISQKGGLVTNSNDVLSMVNQGKRSLVLNHQRAKVMTST